VINSLSLLEPVNTASPAERVWRTLVSAVDLKDHARLSEGLQELRAMSPVPFSVDNDHGALLISAVRNDDVIAIELLLAAGASIARQSFAPIYEATVVNSINVLRHLIRASRGHVEFTPERAQETLDRGMAVAVELKRYEAVDVLVHFGADPCWQNSQVLRYAVRAGSAPMVVQLLVLGADPAAVGWSDVDKQRWIAGKNSWEIAGMFLNPHNPLHGTTSAATIRATLAAVRLRDDLRDRTVSAPPASTDQHAPVPRKDRACQL